MIMQRQAKHTIESVTADLHAEFAAMNRQWDHAGDVNDIEHGGVRYRRAKFSDHIEYIYYIGKSNIPEGSGIRNKYTGTVSFAVLLEGLPKVWGYADGDNCGFDIGWLMLTLESWQGDLTQGF
jgi:hypothetical protein